MISNRCNRAAVYWVAACLALAGGCGKTGPPSFRLNVVAMRNVPQHQQQQVSDALAAMFGTPDDPFVLDETGLDIGKVRRAAGPVSSDQFGRRKGLFREHCAYCHGTSGDGAGPTAAILNPYPRDYRQGKFKFKSTLGPAKPTSDDIARIIREGIPGTAMPSFNLLAADEVESLVEYVKYLSMRGQVEVELIGQTNDLGIAESLSLTRDKLVDEALGKVATEWKEAPEKVIQPDPKPPLPSDSKDAEKVLAASVAAGRELFYGKIANCIKCHGDSAQGDGELTNFDDWNKLVNDARIDVAAKLKTAADDRAQVVKRIADAKADKSLTEDDRKKQIAEAEIELAMIDAIPQTLAAVDGALDPRTIRPRNLRLGIYRGGHRPLDLYRRIKSGILGTPMPAGGQSTAAGAAPAEGAGASSTLSGEQIWQLVDYVRSLPYEEISRPPVRAATAIGGSK